jgi:hypothetical protein
MVAFLNFCLFRLPIAAGADGSEDLQVFLRMEGLKRLCEKYENTPNCHPERSEGSRIQVVLEILRFAQNDKFRLFTQSLKTFATGILGE